MLTSGAFRDARRCLVIADGFYEWEKRPGEPKQPWWVTRARRRAVRLRGPVVELAPRGGGRAPADGGDRHHQASQQLAHVHDRMPVMLPRDAEDAWLDRDTAPSALLDLCVPLERPPCARSATRSTTRATTSPTASSPPLPRLTLF